MNLPVPIVQLDTDLPLPAYTHEGDAGLDLYAREGITLASGGGRGLVPTGISIAIPMGYGTQPYDRFVRDLRAFDADGQPLPVVSAARFGPRWMCCPGRGGSGMSGACNHLMACRLLPQRCC